MPPDVVQLDDLYTELKVEKHEKKPHSTSTTSFDDYTRLFEGKET